MHEQSLCLFEEKDPELYMSHRELHIMCVVIVIYYIELYYILTFVLIHDLIHLHGANDFMNSKYMCMIRDCIIQKRRHICEFHLFVF